uniref:Uncharacterized protein n=1 Tax=Candidozyma auris TaxID=498019 RepID=A0A0L0NXI2_CANAR
MRFLLDQNFHVYKADSVPTFTKSHLATIEDYTANYVYNKYISTTTDTVSKYESVEDVEIDVNADLINEGDLTVSYVYIKHGLASQMACFIEINKNVLALLKSGAPEFLVNLLEAVDFDKPVLLRPQPVNSEGIGALVDSMAPVLRVDLGIMGNIDITFTPKVKLQKDSLKEILINVPKKDSSRLLKGSEKPMQELVLWLSKATRVKFQNLETKTFTSDLICISKNGRIRLVGDNILDDASATTLVTQVCRALA